MLPPLATMHNVPSLESFVCHSCQRAIPAADLTRYEVIKFAKIPAEAYGVQTSIAKWSRSFGYCGAPWVHPPSREQH